MISLLGLIVKWPLMVSLLGLIINGPLMISLLGLIINGPLMISVFGLIINGPQQLLRISEQFGEMCMVNNNGKQYVYMVYDRSMDRWL